jgi:EAL domain-containing protein (putative c-di-GMP-specific phosphodiesterase class I)/GGDEF domain-containing protein
MITARRRRWGLPRGLRLFPGLRSWFDLGTPLELLNPLTVLRVLFPTCAVLWCVQAIFLHPPGGRVEVVFIIAGLACAVWAVLLSVQRLGVLGCNALAALGTAMVATMIWVQGGPVEALGYAPYFLPFLTFVSLFLARWAALAHLGFGVVLFWLALLPVIGVGDAALVAAVAGLAATVGPMAVMMLTSSAARTGGVDPETGLPNAIGLARRVAVGTDGPPVLVATVSLAGIAEAREALGHGIGAALLRRAVADVGRVLPGGAIAGRVEGDEVVVVRPLEPPGGWSAVSLPTSAGSPHGTEQPTGRVPAPVRAAGLAFGQMLARSISAGRYVVGPAEVLLRPHVGIAISPWDGGTLAELVRRTSLAARQAASAGTAQVVWGHPEGTLTAEDLTLLSDLRLARDRHELHLAFQPQVDARSGRTVSAEALIRWQSQRYGDVPPARFITLAERTGFIDRLTEWVLEEALDVQVRWRRAGLDLPVSVNFSGKTLRRADLPTWILRELDARGLPPSVLGIEVTETAATELEPAVGLLLPLHDRGVRISIDDFGTGHTSLALLPHLPLDELKVDMSFVLRSGDSPPDEAIVRSVLELAHRLGLRAVAEGIENEDVRGRMTALGYDLLQGIHFAGALPEDRFVEYVTASGRSAAARATS